jgi:uncharacterized tellurite resistance protein B-like protein
MSILKFLGFEPTEARGAGEAETESVRRIVAELDQLDPDRARYVAAFAFILSRVANADLRIGKRETSAMERIVTEQGGLPENQAVIVVQMAKTQSLLFGGTENYLVTREFNRIATREQKLALLDCLFAVSAADETITTVESNVIRQIADELMLDHREYADVRSRYRDHLSVLKEDRPSE